VFGDLLLAFLRHISALQDMIKKGHDVVHALWTAE
jgi:hypothetical protein